MERLHEEGGARDGQNNEINIIWYITNQHTLARYNFSRQPKKLTGYCLQSFSLTTIKTQQSQAYSFSFLRNNAINLNINPDP